MSGREVMVRRDNLVLAAGLVAVSAASTAGVTIWLLLTSPMMVAGVVNGEDGGTFIRTVVGIIVDFLSSVVRFL